MIKEAINRILELAAVEIKVSEDGREFSNQELHPITPPHPKTLKVATLGGVIDWLEVEGEEMNLAICINGPRLVSVISELDDDWLERSTFLIAEAQKCGFPFGQNMEIEEFIISLQINFQETAAKAEILKYVSNISKNDVRTSEDDGITQTVVTKNEIGRLGLKVLEPIQTLRPFRTFREVEQPEGEFLLRLTRGRGDLPLVALHSAHGIAWELEAIENIRAHLAAALPTATIIR